jgi:hypothetical protein
MLKKATNTERGTLERIRHTSRVGSIYEARRLVASFRQAIFSNAFWNAFWNAFSKSFISSEAPICCAIATKRSWRAASVSLGLASDLRVMLRNPAQEQGRSSHKRPVSRPRDCPLQKRDADAEHLAYPYCNNIGSKNCRPQVTQSLNRIRARVSPTLVGEVSFAGMT